MPAYDIYLVLYARRAKYVRDKVEELERKANSNKKEPNTSPDVFVKRFGG